MQPKFTPGPWEIEDSSIIRKNDHKDQCRLAVDVLTASPWKGEHEGNLRLIAAAPELYKALKELLMCLGEEKDILYQRARISDGWVAIAKAEEGTK